MNKKDENFVTVTFVVSGQAVTHDFPKNERIEAAVHRILAESGNAKTPIEKWVLTTVDGKELNLQLTFSEVGLADGAKLSLNIRTGRGG